MNMTGYNTKWQTKFRSINGSLYTVNICVYGYSGSIISLTADTDPLQLDEVNENDLLDVIRYTTGYVNVLADDSIDVADIFPTNSITDRYVEILEGSTVIFRGYVQAQEFDRMGNYAPTGNPPTSVSIPLISPLGLIADIEFDKEASPTDYSLFSIMRKCLYKLGGTNGSNLTPYTYVYFPQCVSNVQVLSYLMLSSLVISPYSKKNTHNVNTSAAECFEVKTIEYFIEGLCRCFGCMVHDTPDAIVFTKFDYTGQYGRYSIDGSVVNISQPTAQTLAPTVVFDGGIEITQVAPLHKLTCSYDGDRETYLQMSFQHCRRTRGTDSAYNRNLVVNNPILSSELYAPYLQTSCSINSQNGVPVKRGTYLLAYGDGDSMREMAVFNFKTDDTSGHNWAANDMLLKTMFLGYFGPNMALTVKFEWGVNMNLECPQVVPVGVGRYIYMTIKNGSKYLNGSNQWVSTQSKWLIDATELVLSNGVLTLPIPSTGMETIPIEVTFYEYNMREFEPMTCLAITELKLKGKAADPVTIYLTEGENPGEYVVSGNGIDEQDIDIAFACYGQKNSHMLFPAVSYNRPEYSYIFRKRMQVKVTYKSTLRGNNNHELYMRQTTWKGTAMKVIAASYSADYEQMTLTLQEL